MIPLLAESVTCRIASGNWAFVTRKLEMCLACSSLRNSLIFGYMMGSPTRERAQCWGESPSASLSGSTPGTPREQHHAHDGITHTLASHTRRHHAHDSITHTLASHTQRHHTHNGITHTTASRTRWHRTHDGITHTTASRTRWHRTHAGIAHTTASHTRRHHAHDGITHTTASRTWRHHTFDLASTSKCSTVAMGWSN